MAVARTYAVALNGLDGHVVEVEADIAPGLPAFVLIGLPDTALGESRERVRSAALNAGCPLTQRKLTINLSPASLRKQGSGFDLAIAVAALAAAGDVGVESVSGVVHLGELGLDGRLRPIPGVLPSVAAARRAGFANVMVPTANAEEAQLVDGIRVIAVPSLRDAAIWHGGRFSPEPVEPVGLAASVSRANDDETGLDMSDVLGNDDAIEALTVAAAGGHHVSMIGPPGAGKTMLAARLPGILPDLTDQEALEVTSIRSLTGAPIGRELVRRPPFEAPHHTASAISIVGGGSGRIVPGAVVRASNGVLFLDEAPEFPARVLDVLRQPLEAGMISIHRANGVAAFPARFQLVLASNPCPCGRYGSPDDECTCTPIARRRYLARLSGPLLDRVDIRLSVRRLSVAAMRAAGAREGVPATTTAGEHPRDSSAAIRRRVMEARAAAADRLAATPWTRNTQVTGSWLRTGPRRLPQAVTASLDRAFERGAVTMRGFDRTLRLAWTLADLDAAETPTSHHVGAALFLRRGVES